MRNTFLTTKVIAVVLLAMCLVLEFMSYRGGDWDGGYRWMFAIPVIITTLIYVVLFFRLRHLPADARKGQKVVEDTAVVRVKKWGWFDVDASEPGGAPQTAFGSVYYLYVKDAAKKSGQRKFRVRMRVYHYLQPGDEVTIAYLPRSGILLSVDTGGFHYNALDRTQPTQ